MATFSSLVCIAVALLITGVIGGTCGIIIGNDLSKVVTGERQAEVFLVPNYD
jgi:hypothetical protein